MSEGHTIHHHPPFELLLDFVTGGLTEGLALAIATHVSLCLVCRSEIVQLEAVAGALLQEIEPEPIDEEVLTSLLDRLDESESALTPAPVPIYDAPGSSIPAPLRRYVGRSLDDLPWRSIGRMFHEARLPLVGKGVKAALMRLRPGSLMPVHTHRGHEYTLLLAGGYRDGADHFGPGDFSAKDTADQHQPVVDDDGECLCLVVLDAPLKLTGAVGRLVNPFLRI